MVIGCFATVMGLQNAAATYLLALFERTTHMTSNITDVGCELGMRLRHLAGLPNGDALASPDRNTMLSAGAPILGFAAEATAGALLHAAAGRWSGIGAMVPPALVAAWLLAASRLTRP